MMAAAALVLAASSCSTARTPPPVIRTVTVKAKTPAVAKVPCADPVALPRGRRLTDKETADFWGADRSALRICEHRRAAAVASGE